MSSSLASKLVPNSAEELAERKGTGNLCQSQKEEPSADLTPLSKGRLLLTLKPGQQDPALLVQFTLVMVLS